MILHPLFIWVLKLVHQHQQTQISSSLVSFFYSLFSFWYIQMQIYAATCKKQKRRRRTLRFFHSGLL